MFTLTSLTECSSAIRSSAGATAWHGPHHSAQKSTITLPSEPSTSVSKVDSLASTAISASVLGFHRCTTAAGHQNFPPTIEGRVRDPACPARLQRPRTRDPRALGDGGYLR